MEERIGQSRRIYENFHIQNLKFKFEKNHGLSTRNKAIEISSTEWYCHLDGDDLLPKNAVSDIIETIQNNLMLIIFLVIVKNFSKNNSFIRKPYSDYEMLCYSPLFNGQSPIKKDVYLNLEDMTVICISMCYLGFWIHI